MNAALEPSNATLAAHLETLLVANADLELIEESLDVFCPFEALGMVRQEIRHAHFLSYCLNPNRPHGFGAEITQGFMRAAAAAKLRFSSSEIDGLTPLKVHLMDWEAVEVRREWERIDLLLVEPQEKLIVAIELKIDAGEHSGQLQRYRERVLSEWPESEGWDHLFLFLTKDGSEASEEHGIEWVPLDLQSVATEFEALAKRGVGSESARALLVAYIAMLRRHILTDEELDAVAARIWDQHREALEFLMDRQPDSGDALTASLYDNLEEIAERMSEQSGLTIVPDDSSANLQRFAIKEWDQLDDFLTAQNWTSSKRIVLLEIQRSGTNRETLRMRFVLGPSSPEVRQRYFQQLEGAGVPTTTRREITGQFTRLASIQLARNLSGDEETAMQNVLSRIDRYAREEVTAYDRALRG